MRALAPTARRLELERIASLARKRLENTRGRAAAIRQDEYRSGEVEARNPWGRIPGLAPFLDDLIAACRIDGLTPANTWAPTPARAATSPTVGRDLAYLLNVRREFVGEQQALRSRCKAILEFSRAVDASAGAGVEDRCRALATTTRELRVAVAPYVEPRRVARATVALVWTARATAKLNGEDVRAFSELLDYLVSRNGELRCAETARIQLTDPLGDLLPLRDQLRR